MRVIDFSSPWGCVRIPSCWPVFTLCGVTYDVVDGRVRPRPLSPPHEKPGKKAKVV